MASNKEYRDYILEQLKAAGFSDVRCRPMMGEYLLYVGGVLVGGIYDDRLLLKKWRGMRSFGWRKLSRILGRSRCGWWGRWMIGKGWGNY